MNFSENTFLCEWIEMRQNGSHIQSYQNIIYSSLYVMFGVLSVTGNLLNIAVISISRTLRSPTVIMLINMSVVDIGIGIMLIVFTFPSSYKNCWPYDLAIIQVFGYLNNVLFCESIYMLACIAVDRYIAVFYPLKYCQIVTYQRVIIIIAVSWVFTMSNFALPFTVKDGYNYKHKRFDAYMNFQASLPLAIYLVFIGFGISVIVISFSYIKIWFAAIKARQLVNPIPSCYEGQNTSNLKFAFALMSVSIVFFINFSPLFILEFLSFFIDEENIPQWIMVIASLLNYANCFCDCIIYNITYRPFRTATKKVLTCCFGRHFRNRNIVSVIQLPSPTPSSSHEELAEEC